MQDVARGIGLVVALAIGVGCSSTSTNEGSAATGGASSGGAASGGAASGGAAGSAGASSGGGGSAGQDASSGGGKVWCSEKMQCSGLCGALSPVCSGGIVCTCGATTCQPASAAGCPAGMQCNEKGAQCFPLGPVPLGEPCSYWNQLCQLGSLCIGYDAAVPDGGFDFRCRKPCDPTKPPAGCSCLSTGGCK